MQDFTDRWYNLKLFIIEATPYVRSYKKMMFYVWGRNKRHAIKRFRKVAPLSNIHNAMICDSVDHALYVLIHQDDFIVI